MLVDRVAALVRTWTNPAQLRAATTLRSGRSAREGLTRPRRSGTQSRTASLQSGAEMPALGTAPPLSEGSPAPRPVTLLDWRRQVPGTARRTSHLPGELRRSGFGSLVSPQIALGVP